MSRTALRFKITNAGKAAVPQPPSGLTANFTHVAVGYGNAATANGGYQPAGTETALKNEFMRVALGAGSKPAANQISFAALVDGDETGWINEIGLFLQDGTLFALWSEDPTVVQRVEDDVDIYGASLGYKALGVPYTLQALIVVEDFSVDNLNIVVNGPPINLTVNYYDAQIGNLLALVVDRARALANLERAQRADAQHIAAILDRLSAGGGAGGAEAVGAALTLISGGGGQVITSAWLASLPDVDPKIAGAFWFNGGFLCKSV